MQIPLIDQAFSHAILAAGGINADQFPGMGSFTNSILVALIVMVTIVLFARMATRKMALVPDGKQNFVEFIVEFLYGQVEEIVGEKVAPRVFPLLATLFVFILVSNWFGLIPGVGTIGFSPEAKGMTIDAHDNSFVPLLRPATADLNMTFGMAAVFMLVWAYVTISEIGVWGFIVHVFGPKGGLEGVLKWLLVPIFLFVGVIEIISILFRPVSLSFRLLGNVYAGESLLHTMGNIGELLGIEGWVASVLGVIAPIPFYFMEILVGLIQAIVFTLLCAVYVQLSTAHDEDEH